MSLRLNILMALSLLFAPSVFGEGFVQRRLAFHFYGGFSFASNSGTNQSGILSGRTSLSYGLGGEYRILSRLALGLDILHVTKSHNFLENNVTSSYQLTYLTMPMQLKWYATPWLMFHGGPYLANFILAAFKESNGVFVPMKDNFRNDFGLTFGAWGGFQASNVLWVGLNMRYDVGMQDVEADQDPSDEIKTRAFMIMGTMTFTFR